ncbi:MAG: NAD(+) diphosphatase [Treponema sp.]|nr:NAD(+) diphosphatase [Treponema sp.]
MAFFFQGDTLLLPVDTPDSDINKGLNLELSKDFENTDIFEIPAIYDLSYDKSLDSSVTAITGVSVPPNIILPDTWKSIPVRQLLSMFSAAGSGYLAAIIRACHIAQWRRDSRFCGTCGSKNNDVPAQAQRICPNCGRTEFPRICPAVIVVITDEENRILLAHNKRFKTKVYSHISGFNEAGETLEETVVREIREEINIEVKDIVYIKSQPWPFPNSLMLGFKARYSSGIIKPDGDEIEDAKWFTKNNLPDLPGEGSLSRYLINCWLNGTL